MSYKTTQIAAMLAVILAAPGCATITKDAYQNIQIETYSADNQPIKGIKCIAKNNRGEWTTHTPGNVNVHRSDENLLVRCAIDGQEDGNGTLVSRANGGMYGNILLGGGIGAIIDHNKGTAYSYPSWIKVTLGQSLVFDRRNEVDNQMMVGKSSQQTPAKELAVASSSAPVPAATPDASTEK